MSYHLKDFKPKFEVTCTNIPLPLINTQETEIPSLPFKMGFPLLNMNIVTDRDDYAPMFCKIQIYMGESRNLEAVTKQQYLCKTWREERQCRLTASKFGDILMRKATPSEAFLTRIFQGKDISHTASASHGIKSENKAKDIYRKKMSKKYSHDVTLYDVGLVVNPAFPWLGASPDGKVKDVACSSPIRLLEIKCPYTFRDLSPQEASLKPDFFCENIASKVCLK